MGQSFQCRFLDQGRHFVGLQIKPVTFYTAADYAKWRDIHAKSSEKFKREYGGEVFIVTSITKDKKKIIANPEILPLIAAEIQVLRSK